MAIPKALDRFLGINETDSGDTQLAFGEASDMVNYRITDNYKLKQIEGYASLFDSISADSIQGQWYGSIGGVFYHLFACDGTLYKVVDSTGVYTSIGTIADAPTFMFSQNSKVYILDGTDYKSWNGTTLASVAGYIPTVAVATPPTGGGTDYEEDNLLTGKKIQLFSGNASATTYYLREQSIDATVLIISVGASTLTEGTHFTVNRTAGTVNFSAGTSPHGAPASGTNNISIQWEKASASNRAEITSCKKATIFGSRVHVFGGSDKNRRYFSGLETDVPIINAEYFPTTNVSEVGSNEFAITDIVTHNDNYQIILTDGNKSYYSYYTTIDDVVAFPIFELNDSVGNIAFGQAIAIDDHVYSIQYGVNRWETTSVQSQRNAPYISGRIQQTLDSIDLSSVITCNWSKKRELWIAKDTSVVVYNYRNDTWYKFELLHNITSMLEIEGKMYFGDDNGQIFYFDDSLRNFDDSAIDAVWEMGFYDWGEEWLRKFINYTWISIQPQSKINLDVYWITDRDSEEKQASTSLTYNTFDYGAMDYEALSYETSSSPKPKRIRTKAKKAAYFKLILRNDKLNYTSNALAINFLANVGGKIK